MQLPNWTRNLLLRRRRSRDKSARSDLFAPVRLTLRKLEERRVLDVSAAFMTATGVLELDVTNTSDIATFQDAAGDVSIRDGGNNNVDVDVDGGGPGTVALSDVKRVVVRGDAATDQEVVFDTPLSLADGLRVESEIESTVLIGSITSGAGIELGSDVTLESDVVLVGTDVTFSGTIDSQPNAIRGLTIDASTGTVAFNGNIGANVPLNGLNVQRADGGVTVGDISAVQLINTTGEVSIGSTNAVGGTGVVFSGGANATLRIITTNDDVSVNGPTELRSDLSIDTGSRGGDITFTDASPIDGEAGELHNLTLAAGTGSVFLNRDIGSSDALGKLSVTRAAGGVTIGDTAAVSSIHAEAGIDIGIGANEIAGTGIVLNGGTGTLVLQTTDTNIRLNGATTLASNVLFDTGAGVGNATLTNDTPVESESGEFNDLTFDVGAGSVFINEDLGRTNRLGSLTVTTANGGVIFGESTTEAPGSGSTGPVEIINTERGIDIGVGTNTIGGAGVVFRGSTIARTTITTMEDNIRINGPTTLGTDLTVRTNSGAGDLTFTNGSTVDSVGGTTSRVTIDLGDGSLFFNADIGSTMSLGQLSVVSANGGVTFGDTAPLNLVRTKQPIDIGVGANVIQGTGITLNGGSSELLIETLNANVRLNGAVHAQSDVAIDTGAGGGTITLTSNSTIDSDAAAANVRLDAGVAGISINADLGSQQRLGEVTIESATGVELNGGSGILTIATADAGISFDAPIAVQSDVSIDTGPGGGDVTLSTKSTLDSQPGETNNVALTLGTGDVTFMTSIGASDPLGELRVASATDVTFQSDVHVAHLVQEAGTGTTRFDDAINTTDVALAGLDVNGNEFIFNGPVTATGDGRVAISHSGLLDINSSAPFRIDGAFEESGAGTVELAANIVTSGDEIHFASAVTLSDGATANVLLDTTAAGNTGGAAIKFGNVLNAQTSAAETLILNAGASGDIVFDATVGSVIRLGQVQIIEANNVTFADQLVATNVFQDLGHATTTFAGTVNTSSPNTPGIDISAANISFLDAVDTTGDGGVELTVTSLLDLGSAANMNLSGSFVQDGGGSVQTSADITTSEDDITFTDQVVLRESIRIDTGTGVGSLLFASTLDGTADCQQDLMLALGAGSTTFQRAVGGSIGLGDLTIEDAHDVRFESSLHVGSIIQATGSGETRFDGTVTIKSGAGADLTTSSVTINNTFDTSAASGPISINASDDIVVNASVSTGNAPVTLSANDDILLSSVSSIKTTDADVTIRADADSSGGGAGGAALMSDGATIDVGTAVIDISADEHIQLGRLTTTTFVRLTSANGAIVDGGDSGGADIVADELALRARTGIGTVNSITSGPKGEVGTANPLDTSVNILAAENQRAGGVRVENATGNPLTIGDVDGISGIMNGPIGAPEKLVGDVEIIHVGAINLVSPILNDGGSHTIVRAEIPGDLTIDAPIQNRGGNGWIFLFSGGDLIINNSLPEPDAEISVENEGAIRGEARGDVIIDNSETDYVIVRTHSERFPNADTLPQLSPKFADPARYPPPSDTAFYTELEAELKLIRNSISGQATNFAPIFAIEAVDQGGSDVDSNGRGIIKITIGDSVHLETNWHFTIDWGDGNVENYSVPGNSQASLTFVDSHDVNTNIQPDLTSTARIDSGVGGEPGVYYVHHKYLSPPDPADPAAPTPISATLRYDAREEGEQALDLGRPDDGSGIFNGIRFFRNGTEPVLSTDETILTNPGEGAFFAIKIVESVIIPVASRQSTTVYIATTSSTTTVATGATFEFVAATFETGATEDYRLFMQVVDDVAERTRQADRSDPAARSAPGADDTQEFPLPIELLNDPLSIFRERKFPNGHYRIYLEELRTGRVRLILDVHIYEGRVVPENFRDGAAERQPGSDDSSQLESTDEPVAISTVNDVEKPDAAATKSMVIAQPAMRDDLATETSTDNGTFLRRSSVLLPVAASSVPWGDRVRKALRSETRSISRTALRLRRHR